MDETAEEFLYNKAKGHNIDYRIIYKKKLWSSFYSSLDKIENYNLEQGNIPEFEKTDVKEFSRLNEMLTSLIANNVKVYKQQKEFIENASHELQTPLAVFRSQLDMLLQESDLGEKHLDIIQSLYSVSSRLTRLNKNLLLLAKLDNAQFKNMEEVDFTALLSTSIPYLKDLAEKSGIKLHADLKNPLVIHANEILLDSLINNLFSNAIRHNIENGEIWVTIAENSFIISNTGEKGSLNSEKIFKRFSRKTEERKGNGLGLSITSQICKLHNWEIEYLYESDIHKFKVKFS